MESQMESRKAKKVITSENFGLALAVLLQLLETCGVETARMDTPALKVYLKQAWIGGDKGGGFLVHDRVVEKLFAYGRDSEHDHVCIMSFYPKGRARNEALTKRFNDAIDAAL